MSSKSLSKKEQATRIRHLERVNREYKEIAKGSSRWQDKMLLRKQRATLDSMQKTIEDQMKENATIREILKTCADELERELNASGRDISVKEELHNLLSIYFPGVY